MTVQELTRQFSERLRRADSQSAVNGPHTGPCYPMMVLTLGGGTRQFNHVIQYGLRQLWPPYCDDIAFVDTERAPHGPVFTNPGRHTGELPPTDPDTGKSVALTAAELGGMTAELFRVGTHFSRANRILLYALLDTAEFQSPDELDFWLDALDTFRRSIDNVTPVLTMLSVLFWEDSRTAREQAEQIRARLGECLDARAEMPSLMLVSNRRSDSLIDRDGVLCRRLVTALIAVSNNQDAQVVQELFRPGAVMTAGYARAEKPVDDISRICVDHLLDELNGFAPSGVGDLFGHDRERTRERLGLSEDGTFLVLDGEIERNLPRFVPEGDELRELLRAFPLGAPDAAESDALCTETSSARIDALTFGAWNCYLERAVDDARDGMRDRVSDIRNWRRAYADFLRRSFHAKELVELSEHPERVRELAEPVSHLSADTSVRETAAQRLKYLLSSDAEIREGLLAEVGDAGTRAVEFLRAWDELMRTRSQIPEAHGDNEAFIHYYARNLRAFFDSRQAELREKFQTIPDVEGMTDFFREVMDSIFENRTLRGVFAATFEDVGAIQIEQTRATLTGAPVYFCTGFSLDTPFLSFVLLNIDERAPDTLYRTLRDSLPDPEKTRFYQTGRGSAAESLNIFRLQRFHLWSGEGENG
ncbi:MAG: hypothetical protein IJR48_07445 [Oscillibacter sp.]|nr:hypothetical protein [Oscillibacter sp.]MBQ9618183.1 hypothetical protein [Oscillibacter sp.]